MQQAVHPDALTIFGATFDENLDDEIRVTVIATGFDKVTNPIGIADAVAAKSPIHAPNVVLEPLKEEDVPKVEAEPDPFDDIFKIFNKRDD